MRCPARSRDFRAARDKKASFGARSVDRVLISREKKSGVDFARNKSGVDFARTLYVFSTSFYVVICVFYEFMCMCVFF